MYLNIKHHMEKPHDNTKSTYGKKFNNLKYL